MKLITYELSSTRATTLKTELLFYIASAKALDADILRLNIKPQENDEVFARMANNAAKYLKNSKKSGKIQIYTKSWDLDSDTAESEYLSNKFPELSALERESLYFIIKL